MLRASFAARRSCVVLSAFLLGFTGLAVGQETSGSVRGVVTDPSGSAVPGAKLELAGANLRPMTSTTDSSGVYVFISVPIGHNYSVAVTAPGFRTSKAGGLTVDVGKATTLDIHLEVGQVSDSVVVSENAVMVDTASSASAVTVDRTFFDLLPKGRGFDGLINIAPGARSEGKSGGYQIDGSSGSENVFYLDGMEVTSVQNGTLANQNKVPVEAIQQVQIKNGVMEAQYGGAMGGVVSAVIRSGANDFHGFAGFYFNNDALQGRTRQQLQLDPNNDSLAQYFNQNRTDSFTNWNPVFGFGGHLIKDKLFFFASYMPTKLSTTRTVDFTTGLTSKYTNDFTQNFMATKLDYNITSKLRMNVSWIWSPSYNRGVLPGTNGQDSPSAPWAGEGDYTSNNTLSGQVDYTIDSKTVLSFRGGYNYNNFTNLYSVPITTAIYYSNSNVGLNLPGLPGNFFHSTGYLQQAVGATLYNYYPRVNLNADISRLVSWHGQHSLKGGWGMNRLGNGINSNTYPNGYYRYYWNLAYNCTTTQCAGQQKGAYGYYRYRQLGTFGDVRSSNNAMFIQDNWHVNKHLTLNLGLRAEKEYVPSFATGNSTPSRAINFSWADKLAPRLGFAYDPKADGKNRIYASFGLFYDVMKYELPRGSFGGDQWRDYFYTMDDPALPSKNNGVPANPKGLAGKFLEVIDYRIPSNDPSDNTIDPNLKPVKQRMFDVGWDHSFATSLVGSLRYTNRRLLRTVEDTGTLGPAGEVYYISNPGFGITADPKTWGAGYPTTPKAQRDYDAVEVRLDKRFSSSYQYAVSYTYSRLYGNYSGLASSDENGRTSPNVNRYFDLPWIAINTQGQYVYGNLATDRPHTLKFFGSYTYKSKLGSTSLAPNFQVYSGTPITSELNITSGVPAYPYGRGDLGRTPVFANLDLNLAHDFKPFTRHEGWKFRFEFSVFNATNSAAATDVFKTINHADDGNGTIAAPGGNGNEQNWFKPWDAKALMAAQKVRTDPRYGLANAFRGPRSARLQLTFSF